MTTMARRIPKNPYRRTTYDGNTVNWRTRAMLEVVAEKLYGDPAILTVHQGSYNAGGVSASGGTHDGGGAVDLSAFEWQRKVRALRDVGFAAWYRPTIPGLWNEHIHAIAIGDRDLSAAAADQVVDYRNHLDGLASHAHDNFPHHPDGVRFNYQAWRNRQLQPKDWFDMATAAQLEEVVRRVVREEIATARPANADATVKRLLDGVDLYPNNRQVKETVRTRLARLLAPRETR